MDSSETDFPKFISIADCEVCSRLADVETSFYKHAHEEETRLLPPAAARLVHVPEVQPVPRRRVETKRCPICGIFYSLRMVYEYLATGSEDEEILTRLTPAQAKRFLSADEYTRRIEFLRTQLQSASPLARHYAGKCLVSSDLDCENLAAVEQYLPHPDTEATSGALSYLHTLLDDAAGRQQLNILLPRIETLRQNNDEGIARIASSISGCLKRINALRRE